MEAALLALRVTGPSRTGGCEHTDNYIHTSDAHLLVLEQGLRTEVVTGACGESSQRNKW